MHSPPADDYQVNLSSWIQQWIDHAALSPHLEPQAFKLPLTPYLLHHPSRSNSQSSQSIASTQSRSTKRSASPVKPGTLKELQKPVEYVKCTNDSGAQLPATVRQLYRDIYDLAVEREGFIPASEAAWNSDVHSPLLKLTLRPFKEPLIRRHVLTSTRINSVFVPPMKKGSFYDKVGSKMVDYGIALHPDEDSPLGQAIRCALRPLPSSKQYLNQAAYDPIQYAVNVVSIETKTGPGGPPEARSQLGIWIASWSFRMHQLFHWRRSLSEASAPQILIPVPVIVVIEHMWKLSFACDSSHRIDIDGDVTIGDTKSLDGLLMLIAVIRRLACWIQSHFQPWLQEALLSNSQLNPVPGMTSKNDCTSSKLCVFRRVRLGCRAEQDDG